MARARYETGTSARKLEPDYKGQPKKKKSRLRVVEDLPRQEVKISKEQKRKQRNLTLVVIGIFLLLVTISYRNSQINEKFSEVQNLKEQLASIEKENEQLEVSIENSLNANNIEKLAKEQLGMQKLTNKQTVNVVLPKKDYVEPARQKVVIEKNQEESWFQKLLDKLK